MVGLSRLGVERIHRCSLVDALWLTALYKPVERRLEKGLRRLKGQRKPARAINKVWAKLLHVHASPR
ncbi:MAG: hypothetical protein QFX33_04070 [Candidatus Nezhaarchaeota archaeon]|nr:hypothetical protein [Candidatus Nezhaarchaeota archaeon]